MIANQSCGLQKISKYVILVFVTLEVEVDENFKAVGKLPECPSCHDLARPNVLMFGDYKWNGEVGWAHWRKMHLPAFYVRTYFYHYYTFLP